MNRQGYLKTSDLYTCTKTIKSICKGYVVELITTYTNDSHVMWTLLPEDYLAVETITVDEHRDHFRPINAKELLMVKLVIPRVE